MRRTTQKALVNLAIFGTALLFIIFFNRAQSSNQPLAWDRVRYKTSSDLLPEARGICPGLAGSSKPALVVSRVAADGSPKWLDDLAGLYHLCVYTVDKPLDRRSNHLQVHANRGHEAMAYLTFLIDNYAHIPTAGMVFIHGSRRAWHNDHPDYDNAALLAWLNVSAALAPLGYHNMRCDWSLSTCSSSMAPQGSLETAMQAVVDPWDARAVSDAALPSALAAIFGSDEHSTARGGGNTLLDRSHAVRSQCCAQFVVAKGNVLQHTVDEYIALRQWLLDGSSSSKTSKSSRRNSAAPSDDRVAGRILSYVWHILFIRQIGPDNHTPVASTGIDLERLNMQACPRADECYCRLYGRCNLERCTSPGSCYGQYRLPKGLKVPVD